MFKKILYTLVGLLLLLIVAAIAIPYFYKDKIVEFVKSDINKNLNAKVDFKEVDLTLFKSFPNFNLSLNDLTVDGVKTFDKVRLLDAKNLDLTLDIKSVLKGDQIKISKINVDNAHINILVNENGEANYNITIPDSLKKDDVTKFNIDLKSYNIENANILYDDQSMGFKADIKNLNHSGSAKLSDKIYELKTNSVADSLTIQYGNIKYLNRVKADVATDFDISGDFTKFTLKNTQAKINDLPLKADGFVEMKEKEIVMDINYETQDANIAQLLSLVPTEYMPDLKGVKTGGVAQLKGYVKGHSTDADLPGFKLLVDVKNASIQYPDLPEKVNNINLLTDVDFKGGSDLNTMTVDVSNIIFDIVGSRVEGNLNVKQPMSDPLIDAKFKTKMELANVKKAVKLDNISTLSGLLDADVSLKGTVSAIEKQQFNNFQAQGFFNLNNFKMKTDAYKDLIQIPTAQTTVTPQKLDVKQLNMLLGQNDLAMQGSVANYLTYVFGKDEVLKANFDIKSKNLNMNDFMSDTSTTTSTQKQPETNTQSLKIPKNLEVAVQMQADKVLYQKYDISNVKGNLKIANQEVSLNNVLMNLLGGTVKLNGNYNTSGEVAKSTISIGLEKLGIKESANTVDMIGTYAPILKYVSGNFFSDLNLNVDFNDKMEPILKTVNASGNFKTNEVAGQGINLLQKVGEVLKINELKNPTLQNFVASFKIQDGTLHLNPNQFKLSGMAAGLKGTFDLDKNLNLELTLDVPREKLGSNFNAVVDKLAGNLDKLKLSQNIGSTIKTKFLITGTALNPQIKPVLLGNAGQTITETVKEVVETKVTEIKNDALAKAQAEADKLVAEAQQQKDNLVAEAQKLADEGRAKANEAADKLISEAGNNPLKALAAKTAADKIRKEGDKKAQQIVDVASKKGDDLVNKAKEEANQIITKASETGK